jgi:hypothetical protein
VIAILSSFNHPETWMNEPIKAVVEEPGHVQRQPSPPKENKSCQPNSFFRVLQALTFHQRQPEKKNNQNESAEN